MLTTAPRLSSAARKPTPICMTYCIAIKGLLVVYKSILHFASFPIVCRIGFRHTPSHYNVGQTLSSQVCEDSYRLLLCPQNVQKGSATMCATASILVVSSEIVNLVFCVNTLDIIMNPKYSCDVNTTPESSF